MRSVPEVGSKVDAYIELAGEALWLILMFSLPPLLASLLVGLVVILLQALTQVQEQTLTFVPKIIATIVTLLLFAGWIFENLQVFTRKVFDAMLKVGAGM